MENISIKHVQRTILDKLIKGSRKEQLTIISVIRTHT